MVSATVKRTLTKWLVPTLVVIVLLAGYLAHSRIGHGIKLMSEPTKHLAEPQLCDASTKFYENITTMDNDAARHILPHLAASAAAG